MAKELPYFKFFPSEWVTGDITLCSNEAQGLFVNLCCYYWMKNCNMTLAIAKQRASNCLDLLEQLISTEIISVENDKIVIDFLDEQMNEFINVSEKRSIAGKKGAKVKANAKQMLSKCSKFAEAKVNYKDKEIDKEIDKDKSKEQNNVDYIKIVDYFLNAVQTVSPSFIVKTNTKKSWYDSVRLMVDRDKREVADVYEMINRVFTDDFWKKNIRSMDKLRLRWAEGKLDNASKGSNKKEDNLKQKIYEMNFLFEDKEVANG